MSELWKDIPNHEDLYEISDLGRIRHKKHKRIRKLTINKDGQKQITLIKNGKDITYVVHRLVMLAFKPIENAHLYQVNHINWKPSDNRLVNLEWTIQLENLRKKISNSSKALQVFVKLLNTYSDDELSSLLEKHLVSIE